MYDIFIYPQGITPSDQIQTFQAGDTVQFIATEHYSQDEYSGGNPAPISTESPESYQWTVISGELLEPVGRGRFRMVREGRAVFQVATARTVLTVPIAIVPRISEVRFDEEAISVGIPSTTDIGVHAVDANGVALTHLDTMWTRPIRVRLELDSNRENPIAAIAGPGPYAVEWPTPFTLHARRSGTVRLVAGMRIYRATTLRDTASFTVTAASPAR